MPGTKFGFSENMYFLKRYSAFAAWLVILPRSLSAILPYIVIGLIGTLISVIGENLLYFGISSGPIIAIPSVCGLWLAVSIGFPAVHGRKYLAWSSQE